MLLSMSSCIRLALFFILVANMINDTSGSSTVDLHKYYYDAAYAVKDTAEKLLHNLTKASQNEDQKDTVRQYGVLKDILASRMDNITVKSSTSDYFYIYKSADFIVHHIIVLKLKFRHVLADWRTQHLFDQIEQVYKQWTTTCPQYQTYEKALTEEYLSHHTNYVWFCCDARSSVDEWERNFFLRPWDGGDVVKFGDIVADGYKEGRYLSNEGPKLNWYKTKLGAWEQFRVEFVFKGDAGINGSPVNMCELVRFRAVDDGNYFMLTERTSSEGPYYYAILGSQGTIPFWKRID